MTIWTSNSGDDSLSPAVWSCEAKFRIRATSYSTRLRVCMKCPSSQIEGQWIKQDDCRHQLPTSREAFGVFRRKVAAFNSPMAKKKSHRQK